MALGQSRGAKGLWQAIDRKTQQMMPRQFTVTRFDGNTVWGRFVGEDTSAPESQFGTTEKWLPAGTPGVVVQMRGGASYFQPLHMSHPVGRHHYDKGFGASQLGDTNPANIAAGSTAFIAIGYGAKVAEWQAVAIGYTAEATAARTVAVGWSAVASGVSAIAVGYLSAVTGSSGIAIGQLSRSEGSSSIAIGDGAFTAQNGVAIGNGARAATSSNAIAVSTAVGYQANAQGANSTAIGRESKAFGDNSVSIGQTAEATTEASVAIGHSSLASGLSSITVGYNSESRGLTSVAIGHNSLAYTGYSIAIGAYSSSGYAGDSYGEVAIGRSASSRFARGVAIGYLATVSRHYEGVIKSDTLKVEPSSTRAYSKLGLKSTDGNWYYIYFAGAVLSSNTSW